MKVFLCFMLGLGIGIYAVYYYVGNLRKPEVLSEEISVTSTPTLTPTPETHFYVTEDRSMPTEELTPTTSPTITKVLKKSTPTPKPTLKPSPTPTTKISPTITPSPAVSTTPTPTLKPTSTLTPTTVPTINVTTYSSQDINGFIDRFAGQYGVDPNVLRHIATCESGFNPKAVSTNGLYAGLYQFGTSAWNTYRGRIGESNDPNLRYDAEEAVQTAAYVLSVGGGGIWPNCMP